MTQDFKNHIRDIPDFPIPGVLFRGVSPLLASATVFASAMDQLG